MSEPLKNRLSKRRLTRDWGKEIDLVNRMRSVYRFSDSTPSTEARFHPGYIEFYKSVTKFCTSSSYEGNYNSLGFAGYGEYVYPHGVKYNGNFKNGMFHGRGTLNYPMGQRIEGIWKDGRLLKHIFKFSDDLEYSSPWKYCQEPDRRFQSEQLDGLHPAGEEYLTDKQPTKPLKPGCYDTVDGYFDTSTKCVYKDEIIYAKKDGDIQCYRQSPDIIRVCTEKEEQVILANYRKDADEPVGYCPNLYEEWTTGKQAEVNLIKGKLEDSPHLMCDNTSGYSISVVSSTSSYA